MTQDVLPDAAGGRGWLPLMGIPSSDDIMLNYQTNRFMMRYPACVGLARA
jgi:ethanolamine ammonia-lyase large subunit